MKLGERELAQGERGRTAGRTEAGQRAPPAGPGRVGLGVLAGGEGQDGGGGDARGDRLQLQEAGWAGWMDPGLRALDMPGFQRMARPLSDLDADPDTAPRQMIGGGAVHLGRAEGEESG